MLSPDVIELNGELSVYISFVAWPGRESDASVRHVLSKRNIRDIAKNDECNS